MSLEGLQAIFEKKEVVPTVSAEDLKNRPEQVEAGYLYHVRTYLPINQAGEGGDGHLSVEEFERRLIKQVKDGKVPRGYITAGYGYGKTTTALYLWQRAQESNLVIVPPFTMSQLPDLLDAVYGWLKYKLAGSRPALIDDLETLYATTVNRSLEQIANERGIDVEQVESLWRDSLLLLDLKAPHYIKFFEEATRIATDAGFEGLVVMPDEIQQYFRVKQKEGGDPIAPFFEIIQLLNTRASTNSGWRFGFIMVITLEELALIRDTYRRTDLLHRMKDLQIDLSTLYDRRFAPNLWDLMAKRFDFKKEQEQIVDAETLLALGEITARTDISDGPRTAINVFRRMVGRYLESKGHVKPYTPIDLITDFLDEQTITFAGNDKIRNAVRRALSDDRVRHNLDYFAPAVKLAAAYPTDGVPKPIQRKYGHEQALTDLMRVAIGDIVRSGSIEQGAVALIGLAQEKERTSWLPATVREFRLGYNEHARITYERAEDAFIALLREHVFTAAKWKLVDQRERSYILNRSLIFEGTFDSIRAEFPKRRVHVRILQENEAIKDADINGDICIEYRLSIHADLPSDERHQHADAIEQIGDRTALIPINLMYITPTSTLQTLQKQLEDVWSPYELTPLVLSNIYQLIQEKFEQGDVPKREEGLIQSGFMPAVLDSLKASLFNEQVGEPVEAAGAMITEAAVAFMLRARYEAYVPLVAAQNWRSSIDKYDNALRSLDLPGQRQGELEVEEPKDQVAKRLSMSNTGLDSFQRTFPSLLKIVKDFRGSDDGIVCFTLHPLEQEIVQWLAASDKKDAVTRNGRTVDIHQLNIAWLIRQAAELGYLEEETEALLKLLQTRGLAEEKQGWLVEVHSESISLDEVRELLRQVERELAILINAFESNQLAEWQSHLQDVLRPLLVKLGKEKTPNPNEVAKLQRTLNTRKSDVQKYAEDQHRQLRDSVKQIMVKPFPDDCLTRLSKPLDNTVEYSDQVNALMAALRREGEHIREEVLSRRSNIAKAASALNTAVIGYDQLANEARSLGQYRTAADEANTLIDQFASMYQQFNGWRDLVLRGGAIERELENEDPAEVAPIRDALNQLSTAIRGEISSQSRRLDALAAHEKFAQRIEEIHANFDNIRRQRRDAFNVFQDQYRELLSGAGLLERATWRDIAFNPADPRNSESEVISQAQTLIQAAIKRISTLVKGARQTADSLTKAISSLAASQREHIGGQIADLVGQLTEVGSTIHDMEDFAGDRSIIADFEESCSGFVVEIQSVASQSLDLARAVDALRGQVGAIEPTEAEQSLLQQLERQLQGRSEIDVVDLKGEHDSDEGAFWASLRGLYEKDFIRLQVQPKDGQ